jgi:glutamate synthase (NADPH/NADH) large chain
MSGGIAYVLDEDGSFKHRCNLAQVALEKVLPATRHAARGAAASGVSPTKPSSRNWSPVTPNTPAAATAKAILANWDAYREKFVKVYPHEYKRALTEMAAAAQKEAA